MDVLHENLTLESVQEPDAAWREDLRSLVSGYPFERKRRADWPDPWNSFRGLWAGETTVPGWSLAARYGTKVVGWLHLLNVSDVLDEPSLHLGRWELIQRNRDDLRGAMLNAVRAAIGGATLVLEQPTQNRTARRFLRRRDRLATTGHRSVLGGPPPGDTKAPSSVASLPPGKRPDVEKLEGWRECIRGPMRAALPPGARKRLRRWRLSGEAPGPRAVGLAREDTGSPAGLVVVAPVGPGRVIGRRMGRVEHLLIAPDAPPAAVILPLLEWADARFEAWGVDHREASLNPDGDLEAEGFLERRGFDLLTRREGFAGPLDAP